MKGNRHPTVQSKRLFHIIRRAPFYHVHGGHQRKQLVSRYPKQTENITQPSLAFSSSSLQPYSNKMWEEAYLGGMKKTKHGYCKRAGCLSITPGSLTQLIFPQQWLKSDTGSGHCEDRIQRIPKYLSRYLPGVPTSLMTLKISTS